jgi:hypothetical protein
MTTVLAVFDRNNRCIGLCDARCHNATPPSELKSGKHKMVCRCICGGANHAGGTAKAIRNHERLIGRSEAERHVFACDRGLNPGDLVVIDRLQFKSPYTARRMARVHFQKRKLQPDDLFDRQSLRVDRIPRNPPTVSPGGTEPVENARRGCSNHPPPRDSSG